MDFAHQLIFVGALLFLVSILATVITPRLGVPLLLIFLVIGMLAGEDGPGGIAFSNYPLANLAGVAALAVVLFDGGMRTPFQDFRVGLKPAIVLASLGVLITTTIVGLYSAWLLDLTWGQGLLIGAIVGSTDAAAVFSLLHTRAISLNQRVTAVLDIESGTNDPMAVVLTLALIQYLLAPASYGWVEAGFFLVQQMVLGAALGIGGGYLLVLALNRLNLGESLYPLLALFGGLLIYGITANLGGSGFLAAYLAGLLVGNRRVRAFAAIRRFHDGIAWMSQIGMFLILGLLVTPTKLVPLVVPGLLISLVLIFLARPASVLLSLAPFRFPWREQVYIAWVGLRGSVPILLATYPWLAGLEGAGLFFNVAFFTVLVSLVVQGWTVAPAAKLLGLQLPLLSTRLQRVEIDLPGQSGYEIVTYKVSPHSALVGLRPKQLPIPDPSRLVCITRSGRLLNYREWGLLRAGDDLSVLAAHEELPMLDQVFQSETPRVRRAERRFFGEFVIDPAARATDFAESYGVEIAPEVRDLSLSDLVLHYLPHPVVGDRLRLGELELVVREISGNRPGELGLRLPRAES